VIRKSNARSKIAASPRRVRRREAQRDAILRAAGRVFRERGFAETGMRDIAEAADLSAANLYHYFHGKDEILFYCQDRTLDRLLAEAAARRRSTGSAAARLRDVLAAHVRTMLDEVEGATAHLYIDALPAALRERIVAKRDRYERAVRKIVEAGVRRGELVASDPALVTRGMLGALNWTATWFRPGGAQSVDAVTHGLVEFLVRGVSAKAPAQKGRPASPHGRRVMSLVAMPPVGRPPR
jgi:AcrR family transcriptional regulator